MPSRGDSSVYPPSAPPPQAALGPMSKAIAAPTSDGLIYGVQLFMVRRQAPQDLAESSAPSAGSATPR